jgi:hypothetical protein
VLGACDGLSNVVVAMGSREYAGAICWFSPLGKSVFCCTAASSASDLAIRIGMCWSNADQLEGACSQPTKRRHADTSVLYIGSCSQRTKPCQALAS